VKRLLLLAVFAAFESHLCAQVISNGAGVGFPENGAFTGSEIDSVQVNNGNLHVSIPLWSFPGRGVSSHASFVYDSKGWYPYSSCTNSGCNFSIEPESGNTLQMAIETGGYKTTQQAVVRQTCSVAPPYYDLISNFIIREPNGTKHHLVPDPINVGTATNSCWSPGGSSQYADDGSGWVHSSTTFATKSGGVPGAADTNGNFNGATDTLGRAINANGSYYDSQGALRQITVTNETVSLSTHLCGNILTYSITLTCAEYTSQYQGTWSVPHIITLPNGLTYTIEYVQNDEGEISSITLPTGARIDYTYTPGPIAPDNSGKRIASRTITVGSQVSQWTYTYTQTANGLITRVIDPASNYIDYTCGGPVENSYSYNYSQILPDPLSQITKEQYYDSTGTLIKTVDRQFQVGPVLPTSETTTWNRTNQVGKVEMVYDSTTIGLFPDGGDGPVTAPISWGNITEKREYDYGNGIAGPLLRRTDYTYLHLDATVNPNPNRAQYLAANIADRLTSKIVYDGAGHVIAKTFYYYDGGSLKDTSGNKAVGHDYTHFGYSNRIRGNLTQLSVWNNATNTWLSTTYTYDDLGNRLSSTDPGGHTTNYDYSDSFSGTSCNTTTSPTYAFATTITEPSPFGFQTKDAFYQCTSLPQSTRDQNDIDNSRAGTAYTYDLVNRLASATYPDGGSATINYGGNSGNGYQDPLPLTITKTQAIDSTKSHQTVSITDGLGRAIQTKALNPEGTVYVDTTYDLLGRASVVSNPHFSTASPTDGNTGRAYDLFGRTLTVTHPDGNVLATEYDGTAVMSTDEGNGNGSQRVQRVLDYDGLGRLKSVCEVSGTTLLGGTGNTPVACGQAKPMTGFLTTYQYTFDANGYSYTTALQTGLANRVFTYDSLGRLLSSSNPEAGVTSYGYDSDSQVTSRTRPRANQTASVTTTTTYTYDQLHRLLSETYNDGATPANSYCYDETSQWGYALSNPRGRKTRGLVGISCTATSGAPTAGEIYSYDPMGRVKVNNQCTPGTCGVSNASIAYTYDYMGNQLTATDGVSHTFTYATDAAGRLQGAASSLSDANHPASLISAATYGPFGISTLNVGTTMVETTQYQKRGWTQSITDQIAASQAGTGSVSIGGTEQSKQVQTQAATGSTASVTISGAGQQKKVYDSGCNCFNWVVNTGRVNVTINGFTASGYFQSNTATATDVATSLASNFNANGSSPVTASASGASVTFASKATGASTNYSLSTSTAIDDTVDFTSSPFSFSYVSGAAMTGGANAVTTTLYDAGTATITVNGHPTSANWGQNSTTTAVASALAAAINADSGAYVFATAPTTTVLLTSKVPGAGSNYSLSASTATTQPGQFSFVSFTASPSAGTLSGGTSTGPILYATTVGHAPNGDVTSSTDTVNGNWTYTYDEFNRLKAASNTTNSLTWDYDRFGNRWHQNVLAGLAVQTSNTFTGSNNRVNGYSYDSAGNITNDGINKYVYDGEDRVTCVISVASGGSCSSTTGTHYAYDTDGLRVAKYTGATLTSQYVYNLHSGMVSELDGSGNWVRGEIYAGGTYLGTYDNGTTTFGMGDWLGTIRYRAKLDGSSAETCTGLPFGDNIACSDGQTGPSNKHFTGKLHDWESGLDYFGARYYAGVQGRFLTPDWSATPEAIPYGHFEVPQTLNLYAYVGNNPITDTDPDGHDDGDGDHDSHNQTPDPNANLEAEKHDAGANPGVVSAAWSFFAGTVGGTLNIVPETINLVNDGVNALMSPFTSYQIPEMETIQSDAHASQSGVNTGEAMQILVPIGDMGKGAKALQKVANEAEELSPAANKVLKSIDEGGFKITQNAKTVDQEANITITHSNEPGAKLNLRTESHPLPGSGAKPVRHVNVEKVTPRTGSTPRKITNTHITK